MIYAVLKTLLMVAAELAAWVMGCLLACGIIGAVVKAAEWIGRRRR